MDDVSERFLEALSALEHVADEVTSDEAAATLDDAELQLFWREWPQWVRGRGPCGDSSTRTWPHHPRPWANRSSTRWVARVAEGQRDRDGLPDAEGIHG
jgi:hypothetical protein